MVLVANIVVVLIDARAGGCSQHEPHCSKEDVLLSQG